MSRFSTPELRRPTCPHAVDLRQFAAGLAEIKQPCPDPHVGGLPAQVQLAAFRAVVDGVVVREDEAVQAAAVLHVPRVIGLRGEAFDCDAG